MGRKSLSKETSMTIHYKEQNCQHIDITYCLNTHFYVLINNLDSNSKLIDIFICTLTKILDCTILYVELLCLSSLTI